MQTLNQGFDPRSFLIALLAKNWRDRLSFDCPEQSAATRESILMWLLGNDLERFEKLDQQQLEIAQQGMGYRYRILRQRYLGVEPERAYRHLTTRLGSVGLLRVKIHAWIGKSRDRQQTVAEVLCEVIQELLLRDRFMQQQMAWIAQCSADRKLRSALLLASIEEYCLRPIRNKPLIVHRFVNYLRRISRRGFTQVPTHDLIWLVSEEIFTGDSEDPISLLDNQASAEYQSMQELEEQQALRMEVKLEFSSYLEQKIGPIAVQWLQLYLQGRSQKAIARSLNLEIRQVYRLREKIQYHAVSIFAQKGQSSLVSDWLKT